MLSNLHSRTIPGVGSDVTLSIDGPKALIVVSDSDTNKSFAFGCPSSEAIDAFYHPYLFAPAEVLAAVNERGWL